MTNVKAKPKKKAKKLDPKAAERMAIALDAIAQIQKGRLFPTRGAYVRVWDTTQVSHHPDGSWFLSDLIPSKPIQVRTFLKRLSCSVCALGALFVARVDKKDRLTCRDLAADLGRHERNSYCRYLSEVFSKAQLDKIESAFESWNHKMTEDELSRYYATFFTLEPRECLLAILRNIVRNRGTFRPLLEPLPEKVAS